MSGVLTTVCPRCEHDVRGVVRAWRTSCPLFGTCSECGLHYRWGEILTGAVGHPFWSVEGFAKLPGLMVRSAAQYVVASIGVVWMARSLRMQHVIRWRRLIVSLAVSLVLTWMILWAIVIGSMMSAGVSFNDAVRVSANPARWERDGSIRPRRAPAGSILRATVRNTDANGTLVDVHVRPKRLDRLSVDPATLKAYPAGTQIVGPAGQRPPTLPCVVQTWGVGPVLVEAMPPGTTTQTMVSVIQRRTVWTNWRIAVVPRPILVLPMYVSLVGAAGVFVVLPIARRRAKVSWRQVARLSLLAAIGGCGLSLASLALWSSRFDSFADVGAWFNQTPRHHNALVGAIATFVLGPAVINSVWWWAVARWYLRMMRPLAVGTSVGVLAAVLIGLPSIFLVFEEIL
ncbi:MAG: hypothetical protein AB8G96_05330 [Phycisphaerales bacterium]